MKTISIEWSGSYLVSISIRNQMQKYWDEAIIMEQHGHGKGYWDTEIDKLADFLMAIEKQQAY